MVGLIKAGLTVGNGAALNISLGWVPDCVQLYNVTDGDLITTAFLNWVVPFSGGGTNEIAAGDSIIGATSHATARIKQVLLYSGSWAGADAAGFFELEEGSLVGTFASENVYNTTLQATAGIDDATVTANVVHNVAVAAAAASATTTSAISRYEGTTLIPKGFTIGSVIAEEAKALRYIAWRSDQ